MTALATYNVSHAVHLKRLAISHKQKVLSLYRSALKIIRLDTDDPLESREKALEMRARFEKNRNIKDFRVAKKLLKDGQEELRMNALPEPCNFTYSVDGTAYQRDPPRNDLLLDYWHPYEKAMYPYYFARREQRKQEYIKLFESEYGNAEKLIGIDEKIDYSEFAEELYKKMNATPPKK